MRHPNTDPPKNSTLLATVLCAGLAASTCTAIAAPRRLSDAELDRICAKGSTGTGDHLIPLRAIQFDFQHAGTATQVAGSGRLLVEASTANPARVQIASGQSLRLTKNPQGGFSSITGGTAFRGVQIRANEAAVRVTADFDVSVKTAGHQALRSSRDNALMRPAGLVQAAAGAAARREK